MHYSFTRSCFAASAHAGYDLLRPVRTAKANCFKAKPFNTCAFAITTPKRLKAVQSSLKVQPPQEEIHSSPTAIDQSQEARHKEEPRIAIIEGKQANTGDVNGGNNVAAQPIVVLAASTVLGLALATNQHDWLEINQEAVLSALFVLGYGGIVFEELLGLSKSGLALFMAVCLWTIRATVGDPVEVATATQKALGDVSEVILFLVGAMTIVEVVEAHGGFTALSKLVTTRSKVTLLWLVGLLTFFTSSALDNLTTTIVMITLLQKVVTDKDSRKFLGGLVVIAANAGGAWTPIGDVTTTMLWINGDISTLATIRDLFLPSIVSLVAPLALLSWLAPEAKGDLPEERQHGEMVPAPVNDSPAEVAAMPAGGGLVIATGLGSLVLVPVFKQLTGLPPYMGLLGGVALLWLLTDVLHSAGGRDAGRLNVASALRRIDLEGCAFFLGVLMAVSCLDSDGVLLSTATWLQGNVPNQDLVAGLLGLASAVVDNVPLVAAAMGMYDTNTFPIDSELWQLIAFCAGTGGSLLIIGSSAGVAFMGMEKADFFWYLKKISPWAAFGYFSGIAVYLLERH